MLQKTAQELKPRVKSILVLNKKFQVVDDFVDCGATAERLRAIIDSYNFLRDFIFDKYVLYYEDDVQAPPNAFEKLYTDLKFLKADGVCAYVPDRWTKKHQPLAWQFKGMTVRRTPDGKQEKILMSPPVQARREGITEVDAMTWSLTILRSCLVKQYAYGVFINPRIAHDIQWCWKVKTILDARFFIDWDIVAKHFPREE